VRSRRVLRGRPPRARRAHPRGRRPRAQGLRFTLRLEDLEGRATPGRVGQEIAQVAAIFHVAVNGDSAIQVDPTSGPASAGGEFHTSIDGTGGRGGMTGEI
jgi:hypothetical protein